MSEVVVGRKRGDDGILIEIRAIGPAGVKPDELTEHVKLLLAAHEIVVRELRARRAQVLALHLAHETDRVKP